MRIFSWLLFAGVVADSSAQQDLYAAARRQMVDEIALMARDTARETGRVTFGERVMMAMGKVERHKLVPRETVTRAYQNRPQAIGGGQTISQPYIVALMTDLLDTQPSHKVLEIGTGSGYQAVVLAELVREVYTIEIIEALGKTTDVRLREMGYRNIRTRIGDGYKGWPEAAPFDGIIVTAAAPSVPQSLVDQLKPGGKLVIPVGERDGRQELMVLTKVADGTVTRHRVLDVRFVPMTGGR